MAVQKVSERHERDAGDSSPAEQPLAIVHTRRRYFDIQHQGDDTDTTILAHPEVPQPNTLFGPGTFLRVTNRTLRRLSPVFSQAEIAYETVPLGLVSQNPLDLAVEIEYTTEVEQDYFDVDQQGKAIQTVNKEAFDPPPQRRYRVPIYSMTRPIGFDPASLIDNYLVPLPATNSDPFFGRPAGALAIWDMSARIRITPDVTYWTLNTKIARRDAAPGSTVDKAWWLRLKAQGYKVKITLPDGSDEIVHGHAFGFPTSKPIRHDTTSGRALADSDPDQWYQFQSLPSKSFNWLAQVLFS